MHNKGKYVIAERFVIIVKNKIYKYMTSISKNVYIDKLDGIVNEYNNTYHKLDGIVNEYNNTYHRTIKTQPIGVKNNTYIGIYK